MKIKRQISVLIIEDNRLLRDGIAAMIKEQPDFKLAGAISDREDAISKIFTLKPEIVLIDLGLRTQNSLEVVEAIRKSSSESKIIVMDLLPVQSDILDFVKAGASGFILKDAMIHDFLKTIRQVAAGEKVLPPNMTGSLFSEIINTALNGSQKVDFREAVQMTKREREIIEQIADGLTNKEIGYILHLSPYTVKSHVHNILEKMALHTRLEIAKYAYSKKDTKSAPGSLPSNDD